MKIILNDLTIDAVHFDKEKVIKQGKELQKVKIDFKVTSDDYHDVTTLLYENHFVVRVPEENMEFPATIHNYFTSITNLYEEGAVGDFRLELIEKG
ncbi:hypothetical protein CIL03_16385 [Virgibacillus indicus]|uniref:DUF3219 domain-containing protein n=1 Tax=Virgibacillus indicus TaxID=2024554 RepID=A0A265N5T8_9BACI|nr:DUF3219 family protein [Virgibacillus indicus]OZU87398.1 hypothetical protein CIL03_16385 [Virgibacillus indicus]